MTQNLHQSDDLRHENFARLLLRLPDEARAKINALSPENRERYVDAALDTLPSVQGPIDLTFIDADKQNNAEYFRWALRLSRPGALIVVDNVVREGRVIDAGSRDASIQGVRKLNQLLAAEKRVCATAIQTVGSKGYDGFTVALVLE